MTRLFARIAALFTLSVCAAAEEPSTVTSRDGRFVFRFFSEEELKDSDVAHYGSFVVEEKKTRRAVLRAPEEAINSFTRSARVVFAPDGGHLALNFQAGSRYNTTWIYRWTGKRFVRIAEPESALSGYTEAEKAKQLKEAGMSKGTYLRRIWDSWNTERWIDRNTAQILGTSTRTFTGNDGEEGASELFAEILFTVRFEKSGKMKLLKREKPPEQEAETAKPE